MGKPTGFIEYERKGNACVAPLERIKNFSEFKSPLNEKERVEQAARCMNCGVPFCQSGMTLSGMSTGCPLHNLIPEWNDELYKGHYDEATRRLLRTNNFPEFTGRVCPALCEAACTCGLLGEPVSVRDNELFIIEKAFSEGRMKPCPPRMRSGKKAAIIGSGPAGLAVADQLNKRGHSVTVFDRSDTLGGLLTYGIPNMKLDKRIVKRRVELLKAEGIEFVIDRDFRNKEDVKNLQNEFDAVVLCCGAKKARTLSCAGADASGVVLAVDYLTASVKSVLGKIKEPFLSAQGKNVVIVGGGDTGNDCVGTAIRQGCKSVTQIELMPKLPSTKSASNPWPEWTRVEKTDYGQEEANAVFGSDPRVYKTTIKEVLKDENGNVSGVVTVGAEFKIDEKSGRKTLCEIAGSEKILPCELLLIAMGFSGCEDYVFEAFSLVKDARGNVKTIENSHRTAINGIFVAGDARTGQSLVVKAIADARVCAGEVNEYLL